jgi:citrate lyase subunit beta/citryl-CoA lyase
MTTWHRSWLFVPADDERKIERSRTSGADALILDLEDSVAPSRRSIARSLTQELLADLSPADPDVWVRINPIDTVHSLTDLSAAVQPGAGGVVVPKVRSGADVVRLGHHIDALEVRSELRRGSVGIMAVATEAPEALFRLGELASVGTRLRAVTWGAEDLATAVGALANKDADGNWEAPFELARSLALHAAAAAAAQAVDTLHSAFRDEVGLRASTARAALHGFTGKLAVHPAQVPVINAGFTVSEDELAQAEAVIAAFDAEPTAGVVAIDGQMYDRPHLLQAQRVVDRSVRSANSGGPT